jgi:uncharacterized membrane protein
VLSFLGSLHPLIVHLPIGILLVTLFVQILAANAKYNTLRPAVPVLLLCGVITAVFACITGYLLNMVYVFDKSLATWHMWSGIAVACISMLLYVQAKNNKFDVQYKLLAVLLFVLICITGYIGGKMAHGNEQLQLKKTFQITGS